MKSGFEPSGGLNRPITTPFGARRMSIALPTIVTLLAAVFFFVLERARPGRELPNAPGWYCPRRASSRLIQVAITLATNKLWIGLFAGASLFQLARLTCRCWKASSAGSSARSSSTGGTASAT